MRTLQQITDAARRNEPATEEELRLAVTAYDVLLAQLELEKDPKQLQKFFVAAEADPRAYVGPANDPANAEARDWHKAFINVGIKCPKHTTGGGPCYCNKLGENDNVEN